MSDPVKAIRQNQDYVERRVQGVGILGLGGPFRFDLEIDAKTGMPRRSFFMERVKFSIVSDPFQGNAELALTPTIYPSESAAQDAVGRSPYKRPGYVVYTHYRGPENIIFPTTISDTTAPAVMRALRLSLEAERAYANAASKTLLQAFFTLAGLRYAPVVAPAAGAESGLSALQQTARELLKRQTAGRAVVNLGGTGEVTGAINLNPLTGQQVAGVPNLIQAGAESVGGIFPSGSVDAIVSNDIVLGQVNWLSTARGCYSVLRPGGTITIAPYAGQLAEHLAAISRALQEAGFRKVAIEAGRFVTAVK